MSELISLWSSFVFAKTLLPLVAFSSLYEVGIGVNFAFTVYEGFQRVLKMLCTRLAGAAIISGIEQKLLPLLDVNAPTKTQRTAAVLAKTLLWLTNIWQALWPSNYLFNCIKAFSVICGLLFSVLIVTSPYSTGALIGIWEAAFLGVLAFSPFAAVLLISLMATLTGILLVLLYLIFRVFYGALFNHLNEITTRQIPI